MTGGSLYEHSLNKFSKEKYDKVCLPGPMPMWRKSVHDKVGFFKEDMRYAGDWEFFLRLVSAGSKFKKIDVPLGLYYYNNDGLSTSSKYQKERGLEEANVFFNYKEVFGAVIIISIMNILINLGEIMSERKYLPTLSRTN